MVKEHKLKPHPNTGIKEKRKNRKAFQLIVGERLAEVRNAMNPKLTQASLGEALNLNQSVIQRIETGGGTIDTLLVILQYFLNRNYNLNWLIAEDNSKFKIKVGKDEVKDKMDNYFDLPD